MPKTFPVRNAFNTGEISELVEFREDVSKYNSACLKLENAVPLVEGGAKKMPGTYFAGSTAVGGAMFTGSIATNSLNVTAVNYGVLQIGQVLVGPGILPGTIITAFGSGTGGIGNYTLNNSQTVASELMQVASSGKSRLVPFQFSTIQGAILEFSQGIIRVWEGASQGSWSLGLALQVPNALNFNPVTAYVATNIVLVGPYATCSNWTTVPHRVIWIPDTVPGTLTLAAPYGVTNASTIPITITTNSSDALSVTVTGSSPNQGINIALANTTPANNAAPLIQAAIRALVSLNPASGNVVDLTAWTATPDPTYRATPWIVAPTLPTYFGGVINMYANSELAECLSANQFDEFPLLFGGFNTTYWEPYIPATGPIELLTPYLEADLFALDCSTQSADILWIFHPNYPPAVVERLSANQWQYSLSLPGQQPGEPAYRGTLGVVKTGYSGLGQSITGITRQNPCVVTVSATSLVFNQGDRVYINLVAGMVELNQGEFLVNVPVLNGNGTMSFDLVDPNTGNPIDSTGYLPYISGGFVVKVVALFAAPGDYPACGTLYQERLCVGGSNNNPTQMNGSVQDDYPDFICDPNSPDYAIQFTLVSNQVNQLLNMIGTPNALLIGTSGGVWVMSGTNGASLSQTDVNAALQSTIGVSPLQPQLVNGSAIFVSRSTRIVTFLVFSFVTNAWENNDLTRLNRNITLGPTQAQSGIAQTAFQVEPYPIFWAVRNDGQLIGLVFNSQDQVYAWFRVDMTAQGGIIESTAVITGANQEDQLVVVVKRSVNGVTTRYVEYFMPQELFSQLSNAFFVHSGQQLNGGPGVAITGITNANPTVVTAPAHGFTNGMTVQIVGVAGMTQINQAPTQAYTVAGATTDTFQLVGMDSTAFGVYSGGGTATQVFNQVTGLSYLLGNTVVAVGDGALILQPTVVTEDSITFPYYANLITIGIPYKMTVQPTNPVLSQQGATTRGMPQKINRISLSLYQSMGGKYGEDLGHMYDITYGPGTKAKQPQMSTFDSVVRDTDCDWSEESTFFVTQDDPLPFTLRGIVFRLSANQD